ncbi:MAG: hypothetical protein CM1200mP15_02650 [Dehalococcoidia bacterium]|nr:MAG: hypothetical protein CM1200mP15_02650 [Dehalococcoidia bacterium]
MSKEDVYLDDTRGKYTVIEAEVPHSEVQRYAQDLRSLTQGRGTYSLEIDHYEPVPQILTKNHRRCKKGQRGICVLGCLTGIK